MIHPRLVKEGGSPAHAGIDPLSSIFPGVGLGFPRTRGDRPDEYVVIFGKVTVPPHTRG